MRGSAFHWSSRSRSRLAPLRQSVPAASFSASATIRSFSTLASAGFCARSALRASRCSPITRPKRVEPGDQRVEVADRVGVGRPAPRTVLHRLGGLLGRHHAGPDPLLEQLDLEGQRVVAVGEELQRLLGRALGVLPDRALAVGGPHVDGAVVVDPTPLVADVTRHCGPSVGSSRASARPRGRHHASQPASAAR